MKISDLTPKFNSKVGDMVKVLILISYEIKALKMLSEFLMGLFTWANGIFGLLLNFWWADSMNFMDVLNLQRFF